MAKIKEKQEKVKVDFYPERLKDKNEPIVIQFLTSKKYYTAHWLTLEDATFLREKLEHILNERK